MVCPKCHIVSTGVDLFCRECGTQLDQDEQTRTEVFPSAFDSVTMPAAPPPVTPFNNQPQPALPPTVVLGSTPWSGGAHATPYAPQNFSGSAMPVAGASRSYATLIIGGLMGIMLAGGMAVWMMWPKTAEKEQSSQSNSAKVKGGETAEQTVPDVTPAPSTPQGSRSAPGSVSIAERTEEKIVGNVPLTEADLAGAYAWELQRLRNTIFARHGRIFKTPELQSYFNTRAWYAPRLSYSDRDLTGTDRANLNLIMAMEKRASGF